MTQTRKRIHLEIPADWDKMTDEQQDQAAEAMAEEMQRRLGIADDQDVADERATESASKP